MTGKKLRERVKAGGMLLGTFTPGNSVEQAEILGRSGFDFLVLDAEHGRIEPVDVPMLALACEANGCAPLVRVPSLEPRVVGRHLDAGAAGIVAPMVNSRADAEALVSASLYPQEGSRGLAMTRNLGFGQGEEGIPARIAKANEDVFLIAQVETREALGNLDDILSVERLDAIFVGPADLSMSLGIPLAFSHPDFLGAMMQIAAKCREHGKPFGVLIGEPGQVAQMRPLGFSIFAGYLDMMLADMAEKFVTNASVAV